MLLTLNHFFYLRNPGILSVQSRSGFRPGHQMYLEQMSWRTTRKIELELGAFPDCSGSVPGLCV
jgi:hypothetical protein